MDNETEGRPAGNNAAMREALESTEELLEHFAKPGTMLGDAFALHMRDNRDALAKPPRNCDVGTPEEQSRRFDAFCAAHLFQSEKGCSSCPCHGVDNCEFKWDQLPYEGKEESNG